MNIICVCSVVLHIISIAVHILQKKVLRIFFSDDYIVLAIDEVTQTRSY